MVKLIASQEKGQIPIISTSKNQIMSCMHSQNSLSLSNQQKKVTIISVHTCHQIAIRKHDNNVSNVNVAKKKHFYLDRQQKRR